MRTARRGNLTGRSIGRVREDRLPGNRYCACRRTSPVVDRATANAPTLLLDRPAFERIPIPDRPRYNAPAICSTPSRSEEHTSELQSLMRISYAVFCLKKKKKHKHKTIS